MLIVLSSVGCWIDLLKGRPNALEVIIPDCQTYAILASNFHAGPGQRYDAAASLPIGFQELVTQGLLSKGTRRLLARFSYAWQNGVGAVPRSDRQFPDFAAASPYLNTTEPSLDKCLAS